jgi:hypothetical protein
MRVRYWIRAETEVLLSRNGGQFAPHTTKENLIFDQPAQEVAQAMVFVDGDTRICVDVAHVFKYEWDGTQGHCRPCG